MAMVEGNTSSKLLNFLLEQYNLSLEDVLGLQNQVRENEIIQRHKETCTVWQGSNGRWYTYLPDDTKRNKRRMIAKSTEEKLNKEIVAYYKAHSKEELEKQITLECLYPSWIKYKALHTEASSTMHRIDNDWNRYYVGSDIVKKPLIALDKVCLDEWAHELIRRYTLTKTQYYNTTVIMRQALEYAVERGIISENPFNQVKINRKLFKPVKKKADATQVFLVEEQQKIEAEAIADFKESGYTACLGIALCFQLGARLGEMVALKWSDIGEEKLNHIHIQRMERKVHAEQSDGTWKTIGYEVVNHTKSEAGDRNTYLTQRARDLLQMIKEWNNDHGYADREYVFLGKDGNRIHSKALDTRVRKYCAHIGIDSKSMHKIRKTYISTLVDSNLININTIREMVGHEDERTTLRNYTFNRATDIQTQVNMEKALTY
ncbi:MAG: tyrosine-type recombinase/integrase [Lachnospiraceae bacterium]|nr:tyrosine-type recombinase/integrase [Lachnospiraceae bacterium]